MSWGERPKIPEIHLRHACTSAYTEFPVSLLVECSGRRAARRRGGSGQRLLALEKGHDTFGRVHGLDPLGPTGSARAGRPGGALDDETEGLARSASAAYLHGGRMVGRP